MSTQPTTPPTRSPLGDLRAVWPHHATTLTVAMSVAHRQAELLRSILKNRGKDHSLESITGLLGVTVTAINELPVPGTAFWGNGHWNIHIRQQDPPKTQRFNTLHELKHIIDHPGRRATTADDAQLSDEDEELVADHFAACVLTGETA
jgi:hypothetical protein